MLPSFGPSRKSNSYELSCLMSLPTRKLRSADSDSQRHYSKKRPQVFPPLSRSGSPSEITSSPGLARGGGSYLASN